MKAFMRFVKNFSNYNKYACVNNICIVLGANEITYLGLTFILETNLFNLKILELSKNKLIQRTTKSWQRERNC